MKINEKIKITFSTYNKKRQNFSFFYIIKKVLLVVKTDGLKGLKRKIFETHVRYSILDQNELVKFLKMDKDGIKLAQEKMKNFKYLPKISIIMPVYNTKKELLENAIKSVENQIYDNWELCIVDDCSKKSETLELLEQYKSNSKIKILNNEENMGISKSSNKALKLATGEYIGLLDHDDELTIDALYRVVEALNISKFDVLYSDECNVDEKGNFYNCFFKPDWSPELLFNYMYVGHFTVYKKSIIEEVNGFRNEYDFSQDYDLMLRVSEITNNIFHINRILYYWRMTEGSASIGDKPYARMSNLKALGDTIKRRNLNASVVELPFANRLRMNIDNKIKVSIIVPTDSEKNLKDSITSINSITTYPNYEIVAVTNSKLANKLEKYSKENVVFALYDKPYNFSDKCNFGAEKANGEILIFYNDDVRPLSNDWIENLVEYLNIEKIGGVSPRLIYENKTIQYCGMVSGVRNLVGTAFHCWDKDNFGYFNFPFLVRDVSILCGACLAINKQVFFEIDGFDHINTPSSHSDVDISYKLLDKGYRCVYTPYTTLMHIGHMSLAVHEEKQKKFIKDKSDIYLLKKWVKYVSNDPYFTDSMIKYLYHDSPEQYKIYYNDDYKEKYNINNDVDNKDILLITHDLSRSGAPIMLLNLAKILKKNGYFVTVVSPEDGALRLEYEKNGIIVIEDELVLRQHETFEKFSKNFDLIISNTIVTWPVIKQHLNNDNYLWWIHEAQLIDVFAKNHEFVEVLEKAKNIITVSEYSKSYILKYKKNGDDVLILPNGLEEREIKELTINEKKKKSFSLIGSIESRKGQDIFIEAIKKLPESIRKSSEFNIIGRILDVSYKEKLDKQISNIEEIKIYDELSHNEAVLFLENSDVIVCPSRDDPFPTVILEALRAGKVTIMSTNTGTRSLIIDKESGIIFNSEDINSLVEAIKYVSEMDQNQVSEMSSKAREIYDIKLKESQFEKEILGYIKEKI